MNIDWAQHLLFDELLLKGSEESPGGWGVAVNLTLQVHSPEMFGAILGDPWVAGLR